MEKNEVLDIIISFVNGCKDKSCIKCNGKRIGNTNYLLNQILRQYDIDDDHILVSKKARALWTEIAEKEDIRKVNYRKTFEAKIDKEINMYFGAKKSGEPTWIKKGQKVIWNNIFHDEHAIPINVIIKELCSLEPLNYENVLKVLDKIYICKMLKEEDRNIKLKSNRPADIIEVVEKIYNPNIEICEWDKIKTKIVDV